MISVRKSIFWNNRTTLASNLSTYSHGAGTRYGHHLRERLTLHDVNFPPRRMVQRLPRARTRSAAFPAIAIRIIEWATDCGICCRRECQPVAPRPTGASRRDRHCRSRGQVTRFVQEGKRALGHGRSTSLGRADGLRCTALRGEEVHARKSSFEIARNPVTPILAVRAT